MQDSKKTEITNRDELVEKLKKQALLLNHGRLLQIMINVFAEKKSLEKLGKREGQEIQINFPAYDIEPNCLTFVLSKTPSDPVLKPSDNPKVVITFNATEEELVPMLIKIISAKYNAFGLLKLVFKFLLTRKITFKPKRAIGALLSTMSCFLIGNNELLFNPGGSK